MLHGFWLYNTALYLQDVGRCCAFRGDRGWVTLDDIDYSFNKVKCRKIEGMVSHRWHRERRKKIP